MTRVISTPIPVLFAAVLLSTLALVSACNAPGERCMGAAGMPAVSWVGCCPTAAGEHVPCVEDASKGWGSFCKPDAPMPSAAMMAVAPPTPSSLSSSSGFFSNELFNGKGTYYGTPPMAQFNSVHCSLRTFCIRLYPQYCRILVRHSLAQKINISFLSHRLRPQPTTCSD
jgi:hypothetical protein